MPIKYHVRGRYARQGQSKAGEDFLVSMLHKMALALGYDDFDELLIIRKGVYFPKGHGELEDDQTLLRKGLISLLAGKISLKMDVISFPPPIEMQEQQKQITDINSDRS